MSTIIVTTAYLGEKKNLKTAGISPVIDTFVAEGKLEQVICQVHKNFYFPNTSSAAPVLYRYIVRVIENTLGISLKSFRKLVLDFIACWNLQDADVVIFHPSGSFKKTIQKAKRKGSITMGIATVAHPKFEEALYQTEYKKFGVEFQPKGKFDEAESVATSLDYIIAYSDFVKSSYVVNGFPPERIFVGYSDIPLPVITTEQSLDGKFRVLFLAYISPRKGLQYLLEAWDALSLPDAELVIVGEYGGESYTPPEFKEYCDAIIQRNSNIVWIGKVTDTDSYYQAASLFVFPSLSEGNPKVVMEAMSYGLPVIVTPNAQSIVEDGKSGYVVPIRDADAIGQKISFLNENRNVAKQMGEDARNAMETKEPFGKAVFRMYQRVAK